LEQNVDCIAEATRALGENHHTPFCRQPDNLFHLDNTHKILSGEKRISKCVQFFRINYGGDNG